MYTTIAIWKIGRFTVNLFSPISKFLGNGTRVDSHPQVVKDPADISCQLSHFLSDIGIAFCFDNTDCKAAKPRHIFRAAAGAYTAAVFIVVPVQDIVAAIFDNPLCRWEWLAADLFYQWLQTGEGR